MTRLRFLLILAASLQGGCSEHPPRNTKITDPEQEKQKSERGRTPVEDNVNGLSANYALSAGEFAIQSHDRKYQDAIVELVGIVREVHGVDPVSDDIGREFVAKIPELKGLVASVKLVGSGSSDIACYLSDKEPWRQIVPGQRVKVKGRYQRNAVLTACVLVEPGPFEGVVVSAAELAGEFAKDREATNQKYENRYVIVTGDVKMVVSGGISLSREAGGVQASIFFKDVKTLFQCGFRFASHAENLRGPQRIAGWYSGERSSANNIELKMCQRLKAP